MTSITKLEHRLVANEQLVFVHVPKTGGLTFRGLLANHFDFDETCPNPDEWWWVARDTKENVARYRLFNGHYVYSVGELLRNPVYITMLRHPVDRLVSTHRYILKNPNSFQYDYVAGRRMSVEEFLENPVTASAQTNWQAGFVGSVPVRELLDHQTKMSEDPSWRDASGASFYPSLGVDVAIERLERFAMFGLCERFQDAAFMLQYVFGWKPATDYQSFNITTGGARRADLDPRLIDLVLSRNAQDATLHEHATKLFDVRFRRMCDELLERYGDASHARMRFPLLPEVMVELLQRHYERRRRGSRSGSRVSFVWDVARAVDGSGWHAAEPVKVGRFARWTGPGRTSTLDVALAPGNDYVVEFEIGFSPARDLLRGMELRANGVRLKLKRRRRFTSRRLRFLATIPRTVAEQRTDNLVTLEWTLPRTIAARAINPKGGDERIVGVMFRGVRVSSSRATSTEGGHDDTA